jgi:hypothetical protein
MQRPTKRQSRGKRGRFGPAAAPLAHQLGALTVDNHPARQAKTRASRTTARAVQRGRCSAQGRKSILGRPGHPLRRGQSPAGP